MSAQREDLLSWVWLSLQTENAPTLANTLLKYFGSAQAVYQADRDQLEEAACQGRRLEYLCNKDTGRAQRILDYCQSHHVGIVTLEDHFYPQRLKAVYNRPILLYYLGNFIDLDASPCVAVVGTRKATDYAIRCAKRISLDLALGGAVTVSGLAAGVDACAHKASLYANAFTVGVLGCGIDRVYPEENRELYTQVAQNGLLITEYAPSTPPRRENFPQRNRIIAGLAGATAVIEGPLESGSLITAEHSLRLQRPVFSVPGSIFAAASAGTNALLTLGAKPLLSAEPILQVLGADFPDKIRYTPGIAPPPPKKPSVRKKKLFWAQGSVAAAQAEIPPEFEPKKKAKKEPAAPAPSPVPRPSIATLDPVQLQIYTLLSQTPMLPDQLVSDTLPARTVLKTLTLLEMKGFVKKHPGGRFSILEEE